MSLTDRVRELKHLLGKLLPRTVSKGRKADEEPSQEVTTYALYCIVVGHAKLAPFLTSGAQFADTLSFKCMNKG